jgi:hypothetical protein
MPADRVVWMLSVKREKRLRKCRRDILLRRRLEREITREVARLENALERMKKLTVTTHNLGLSKIGAVYTAPAPMYVSTPLLCSCHSIHKEFFFAGDLKKKKQGNRAIRESTGLNLGEMWHVLLKAWPLSRRQSDHCGDSGE